MDSYTFKFPSPSTSHLTVAIKDSIDVAGSPTRLGCAACINDPAAQRDARVVKYLKENGFFITGKTVMHELAFGMTGINKVYGTPTNPLYPTLIPGGSSSGSATAVASGEVDIAIGTDTGGSVRLPAAYCGIYGIKPTFGLVSREGVWPSNSSLDCVGIFAKKASLITRALQSIVPDFDPITLVNEPIELGWINVEAKEEIKSAVHNALAANENIHLIPRKLPDISTAFQAALTIINRETWIACQQYYATGLLGEDVAKRLKNASLITDDEVAYAEYIRSKFTHQVDEALKKTRALALPTLPNYPISLERALSGDNDLTISKLVRPFNLSGHPAITIPCPSEHPFPIGIQLVGRKGDDAFLCALAEQLQAFFSR